MKTFLTFILFLTLNISAIAQTIKGTIVSEKDTTLISATIKNLNNDRTTITNGNGFFQISANSNDSIEISYIGFQPIIDRTINLSKKDTLTLKEKTTSLNNIVVTSINPLSIVTKIVSKNKQYIPKSYNYDVYVKTTVSINAELQYYSDAILNYIGNGKNMKTYIKASRCIRKSDTTMEKIIAKGTIYEKLHLQFLGKLAHSINPNGKRFFKFKRIKKSLKTQGLFLRKVKLNFYKQFKYS